MLLFNNLAKLVHVNFQCEHFIPNAEGEPRLCVLQLHDNFIYNTPKESRSSQK